MNPLALAFAGSAAKKVVERFMAGDGSPEETERARLNLAAIDAQAAIGQRSARPFLQYVAGGIMITYTIMTVLGLLINTFIPPLPDIEWKLLYTEGYLLIGWAITYTTGMGAMRGWNKGKNVAGNPSVARDFAEAVSEARGGAGVVHRTRNITRLPGVAEEPPRPPPRFVRPRETVIRREPINRRAVGREIRIEEGTVFKIYPDPKWGAAKPTFGVGILVTEDMPEHEQPIGTPVSKERVRETYNAALDQAIRDASSNVQDFEALPEDAKRVLVGMAYNMGDAKQEGFVKMLAAMNARDWTEAAAQIRDSDYWRDKTTGKRAERYAARMEALDGPRVVAA